VGRTCTVFASDGDVFSHRRAVVLLMPISSEAPANHQMVSQCHSDVRRCGSRGQLQFGHK
jgi:hypothetical protein